MTIKRKDKKNLQKSIMNNPKKRGILSKEVSNLIYTLFYEQTDYISNTVIKIDGGKFARMQFVYLSSDSNEIIREFAIKFIEKKIKKFRKRKLISLGKIVISASCSKIAIIDKSALIKKENFKLKISKNFSNH